MEKFIQFIDEFMALVYRKSLSIMDLCAITIISAAAQETHWIVWLALIPWVIFSTRQSIKYND